MWNVLAGLQRAKGLANLREEVRELPDRARVSAQLGFRSGMIWELTAPGIVELVKVFTGSQNPSRIYRVHGRNTPNKAALIWRDQTLTWSELDDRVDRYCAGLARRGIARKQSIVIMMRNRPEALMLGAAAARGGIAAVTISWRSTAQELTYLLNHSGARAIVTEPEFLHVIEEASAELSPTLLSNVLVTGSDLPRSSKFQATPLDTLLERGATGKIDSSADDDAAVVVYTSGTTGKPKGAVRKFPKDTMAAAMRFINETPMRVDDVHLVTCPLYHSTAFGFLTLSFVLGNTAVIMEEFKPEPFLQIVERHKITTTATVPTMLHRVLELPEETRNRYNTRSLRVVFTGGAPLPGPVGTEFMDTFGDILYNFYGATETGVVTLAKPDDLRAAPACIGKAVPGNEIRLLDDAQRDVRTGEVGELYVKNKLLVAGYHRDDEATKSSMIDGFFSVGDLARCDRDGRYFIEGRKRDMVISGGVNVYPAEVEGVLEQHPDIGEVAVVGVPDREWGERVRAFVVPRPGATLDEAELKAYAKERLAGPKVPRDFVVIDVLPRNPTGKVLKRELRERQI